MAAISTPPQKEPASEQMVCGVPGMVELYRFWNLADIETFLPQHEQPIDRMFPAPIPERAPIYVRIGYCVYNREMTRRAALYSLENNCRTGYDIACLTEESALEMKARVVAEYVHIDNNVLAVRTVNNGMYWDVVVRTEKSVSKPSDSPDMNPNSMLVYTSTLVPKNAYEHLVREFYRVNPDGKVVIYVDNIMLVDLSDTPLTHRHFVFCGSIPHNIRYVVIPKIIERGAAVTVVPC